jgi:hypothetical protein
MAHRGDLSIGLPRHDANARCGYSQNLAYRKPIIRSRPIHAGEPGRGRNPQL